jgi:hypothetical protein
MAGMHSIYSKGISIDEYHCNIVLGKRKRLCYSWKKANGKVL